MILKSTILSIAFFALVDGAVQRKGAAPKQFPQRCTYPNGDQGICLPVKDCPQLQSLSGSQSVKFFLLKFECGGNGNVCCPFSGIEQKTSIGKKLVAEECIDPVGKEGVCTPIKKCPSALHLLLNHRRHEAAMEFLRKTLCRIQDGEPIVCCYDYDYGSYEKADKAKQKLKTERMIAEPPKNAPQVGAPRYDLRSPKIPGSEFCGSREPFDNGIIHVTNGLNATLAEWPWMAALGYESRHSSDPSFNCGGTLFSNRHILTAAHCMVTKRKLAVVRLGDLNLYSKEDGAEPIDGLVKKIFVHERYNAKTFENDIAIIVLRNVVPFSENIRPICLPLLPELRNRDVNEEYLQIAGWGNIFQGGPSSVTLQDAVVHGVREDICKTAYKDYNALTLDSRVFCAGNLIENSPDACRGDSGGPIMDGFEPFYQVGIISYGKGCAQFGFPGVYTKVASYLDWILDKVEQTKDG